MIVVQQYKQIIVFRKFERLKRNVQCETPNLPVKVFFLLLLLLVSFYFILSEVSQKHVSTGEEYSGSGPHSTEGLGPRHLPVRNPERPPAAHPHLKDGKLRLENHFQVGAEN